MGRSWCQARMTFKKRLSHPYLTYTCNYFLAGNIPCRRISESKSPSLIRLLLGHLKYSLSFVKFSISKNVVSSIVPVSNKIPSDFSVQPVALSTNYLWLWRVRVNPHSLLHLFLLPHQKFHKLQ